MEVRTNKHWSEEEILFLESEWGKTSTEVIARKLKRKESAVKSKASKLGLGSMLENKDFLTAVEVARMLGTDRKTLNRHIEERGLKARGKSLSGKMKVIEIKFDNLVKWLTENPQYWNGAKVDRLSLELIGVEKFFLEKKIEEDTKELQMTTLSDKDIEMLKVLYKKFYTYEEIANKLNKKYSTIKWKIHTLIELGEIEQNTKEGRIVRRSGRQNYGWEEWQDKLLMELYIKEGRTLKEISEIVGKSLSATKSRNQVLSRRMINQLAI